MKHTPEGQTAFENDQCPDCGKLNEDRTLTSCSVVPLFRALRFQRGRKAGWFEVFVRLTGGCDGTARAEPYHEQRGDIERSQRSSRSKPRAFSREILLLSTLQNPKWNKSYSFEGIEYGRMDENETFSKKLVREVIGESIPPLAMLRIVERLLELDDVSSGTSQASPARRCGPCFASSSAWPSPQSPLSWLLVHPCRNRTKGTDRAG